MRAGADPLRVPDPVPNARWQRGEVVGGLYLADSAGTAWAEWYRALAERGLPPREARDLWRLEVDVAGVADLRDLGALAGLGLAAPRPDHRTWPAYQALGHAVHAEGYPGLVAPSAARPVGVVLCLFRVGERVEGAEPLPPPEHHASPPAVPRGMTT